MESIYRVSILGDFFPATVLKALRARLTPSLGA